MVTRTAATANLTDVQNAVNASSIGDKVVIPAGNVGWGTGTLNITAGIELAGTSSTQTIINRNTYIGNANGTNPLILFNASNGLGAVCHDMALVGFNSFFAADGTTLNGDCGLSVYSGSVDFKIYNMDISNFTWSGIRIDEGAYGSYTGATRQRGVIYNCNIHNNATFTQQQVSQGNLGYGVAVFGSGHYTDQPITFGQNLGVFIEDCTLDGNRHNVTSNNGSIYIARHNNVIARTKTQDWMLFDMHGKTFNPVGSRSAEFYNNTLDCSNLGGTQLTAHYIRGGSAILHDNTIIGGSRCALMAILGDEGGSPYGVNITSGGSVGVYYWNPTGDGSGGTGSSSPHQYTGVQSNTSTTTAWLGNDDTANIVLNQDFFLKQPQAGLPVTSYTPFTYPHPLRTTGPLCTITSPTTGTQYSPGNTISVSVTASAQGTATMSHVDLFVDGSLFATDTVAPYTFSIVGGLAVGNHTLMAVANDSNQQTTSSSVSISVVAAPSCTLTAPLSGQVFTAPATIHFAATASAAAGILGVAFWANGIQVGSTTTSPYTFDWTNVSAGSYNVFAAATDNNHVTTNSTSFVITVQPAVANTAVFIASF